ncbi:subtilisin-like serine endopeptidase family protein [Striga asiatica]|uniref:Subtilisin-like serine endopeptidase family protein n=1 Tax=Striga asiatica TaxID=4170 RepID=A0A5A7PJ98_STRAF|nr:subtilisin-like serine endopeptidase family protein [Striga asiatica]
MVPTPNAEYNESRRFVQKKIKFGKKLKIPNEGFVYYSDGLKEVDSNFNLDQEISFEEEEINSEESEGFNLLVPYYAVIVTPCDSFTDAFAEHFVFEEPINVDTFDIDIERLRVNIC